jgi:hypothetical protein
MNIPFFDILGRLDGLIAAGPKRCNFESDLKPYFSNPQVQKYFFQQLQSADWLELLFQAGVFNAVPQVITEGNTIAYPFWPAGDYLKRMAPNSPELVPQIAVTIPETANLRVHDDLATAMISVPGRLASDWAIHEAHWLTKQASIALSLPMTLGRLMQHLASEGEVEAALTLASPLLAILDFDIDRENKPRANPLPRLREPRTRIGLWEYEQILTKNIPSLVDSADREAMSLLCNLLDQAIVASDQRGSEARPNDLSRIWRPAIEDHVQNTNMGIKPLLVTGVRNAAEQIASNNLESLPDTVESLNKRGDSWIVFRRIALHLVRLFSESISTIVRTYLLDRANFDEIELQHEYFLLAQKCFGLLSTSDQTEILGWIETGPILTTEQLKNWQANVGRTVTDEDKKRYAQQWKRDHLAPIAKQLTGKWVTVHNALLHEEGEPFHPEFSIYHQSGGRGPNSPLDRDDIAEMTPPELVAYLNSWKPTEEEFGGATPEGLGRTVSGVVSGDPAKYAEEAIAFTRLYEPTYVRSTIQGFHDALRQGQKFDWAPVLELCAWAVTQAQEEPVENRKLGILHPLNKDPDWSWTKTTVARLLIDGLASKTDPIPFIHRDLVWTGIEAGTKEADPSAENEGKEFAPMGLEIEDDEPNNQRTRVDLMTRAINSARGVAIGAVIDYALWVRRALQAPEMPADPRKSSFQTMPEVQSVLEAHLDKNIEKSLTIRSIYGQRAPWLQLLDPDWAAVNTARIFDRSEPIFWHAAWDTYIGYSGAYDNVFEWLRAEYAHAIEQVGAHRHFWASSQAPDFSLAQHLMTLYWRGKLDIKDPLLARFYLLADATLRKHALNFIGRSLRNTVGAIPADILERLQTLWMDRLGAASKAAKSGVEELQEFGLWFASEKFDPKWSVQQLLAALAASGRVELDFMVVDRLAEIAPAMPLDCVEALRMIAESDSKGWTVSGWSDKAKDILKIARASRNPEARHVAEDLINYLGSLGYFDFRDLLKDPID